MIAIAAALEITSMDVDLASMTAIMTTQVTEVATVVITVAAPEII